MEVLFVETVGRDNFYISRLCIQWKYHQYKEMYYSADGMNYFH
jgi:hypothetical protein